MTNIPQGWQCPVCGRVYSPGTSRCSECQNKDGEYVLPYEVRLPNMTFGKGVSLSTLINAASRWKQEATSAWVKKLGYDSPDDARKAIQSIFRE